jgi:hypothetical protein
MDGSQQHAKNIRILEDIVGRKEGRPRTEVFYESGLVRRPSNVSRIKLEEHSPLQIIFSSSYGREEYIHS